MSDKTGISWTDATWNPIRGCTRVSEGCRHCYAETVAHRHGGPGQPYEGLTTSGRWNGTIKVVDEHLEDPLRWKRPRRVFVNSMSDLFHENVADETIDRIFAVMACSPRHTFQVLTKRPERMRAYMSEMVDPDRWDAARKPLYSAMMREGRVQKAEYIGVFGAHPRWPLPNVWLGVSVEDQATADRRIPLLLHAPAAVRFISAEPLLGPIDLKNIASAHDEMMLPLAGLTWSVKVPPRLVGRHPRLDWVIVGGESGPGARPCDVAWVRSLLGQCTQAHVACFVKQLGARPITTEEDWRSSPTANLRAAEVPGDQRDEDAGCNKWGTVVLPLRDRKGADMAEWPEDLRVQQYPEARS